ncbi:MAG: hypothetical protein QME60_06670 [Verrucomicrobiota bacterium]|nr:hypothetical protein [Verrucomicrobiota bacterium]
MRSAKRVSFWVLLVAFVALSAWWCVYFPYEPERLLRAVPPNAVFVSRHRNLAERWRECVRNPAIQHFMAALDADSETARKMENDDAVERLARQYAGRDLVIAYVPTLPGSSEPAWVFASWAGAGAQRLKFLAECGLIEGAEAMDLGYGRKGWRVSPDHVDGAILSVATVGGVILGCLSDDPAGVRHPLARLKGRAPVLPAVCGWLKAGERGEPDWDVAAPDRGWIKIAGSFGGIEFRVRSCTADALEGSVSGELNFQPAGGGTWASPEARSEDARQIEEMIRDAPAALATLPLEAAQKWFFGPDTKPEWQAVAAAALGHAAKHTPGFIAIGKPEYNGHIMGLGVPSALAGIKLKDPTKAPDLIAACLDLLNAAYGFGVIAKSAEIAGQPATVIKGIKSNGYGRLKSAERVAMAARGDWLILASNRDGLTKIMAGWKSDGEAGSVEWARALSCSSAPYFAWVDLHSARKGAGVLLALCDLMSLAGASVADPEVMENLELAKNWLDALKPLRHCRLSLRPAGRQFDIEFSFSAER